MMPRRDYLGYIVELRNFDPRSFLIESMMLTLAFEIVW